MRKLTLSTINPATPPTNQLKQIRDNLYKVALASGVKDTAAETVFSSSGLAATNVQDAIEELTALVDDQNAMDGAML